MLQEKLIWILTASTEMADNLGELLGMDGYYCQAAHTIQDIKTGFNALCPQAIILDELNNKGAYREVVKIVTNNKHPKIIILCSDCNTNEYPLAHSCLQLPTYIESITQVLVH